MTGGRDGQATGLGAQVDSRSRLRLAAGVATGVTGVMLAYARWVERLRIEVNRMQVRVTSPGLSPVGLRVLHLSDMHFTGQGRIERMKIDRTVQLVAGEQIDLLLVTGDLIHDDGGLPAALGLLDRLPKPRLGAFACLGNHDYACYSWLGPARVAWREAEPGRELQAAVGRTIEMGFRILRNDRLYLGQDRNDTARLRQGLEERGIQVLDNCSRRVQLDGTDLWLAGVDDLLEGAPDVAGAVAAMPEAETGSLRILLFHNPDHMLEPVLQQFDLAFGGHVHGGQILLPLLGALHTQGTHLSRRRPSGWFRYGRTQTYIGRGLGEGVRLRFRCRPEVALVDIQKE
jgi:predicted MPP superfamily phosphohydrolase